MKYLLIIIFFVFSYSQNIPLTGKWKSTDNWAQIEFFPDNTCVIIEKNRVISPRHDCVWNEKDNSVTYVYKGRNSDKFYFKYYKSVILASPSKRKLTIKKAELIFKKAE
jgi:hypothetical protein